MSSCRRVLPPPRPQPLHPQTLIRLIVMHKYFSKISHNSKVMLDIFSSIYIYYIRIYLQLLWNFALKPRRDMQIHACFLKVITLTDPPDTTPVPSDSECRRKKGVFVQFFPSFSQVWSGNHHIAGWRFGPQLVGLAFNMGP